MYLAQEGNKRMVRKYSNDLHCARKLWSGISRLQLAALAQILQHYELSVLLGDVLFIGGKWYVTHVGLLRVAYRRRCHGIQVRVVPSCCDVSSGKWVFRATVFKTLRGKGFVGYGDADPSNVSSLVHGAEMRVAETRAVNRALRKAYGIGICSVEEIGSFDRQIPSQDPLRRVPRESSNGNNGHGTNGSGSRVRDRLCQLIRQHKLDAELVKAYAVDFCGTKTLRDASREQVEAFVAHLADWAVKDRNALLCQLNSYQHRQEPARDPQQRTAGAA